MKPLLFAIALTTTLHAEDAAKPALPSREELAKLGGFEAMPDDPADSNIYVEMQIVSLPQTDAMPLIEKLNDPAQIEQAYAAIQELLRSKKAKLVGWPSVITKSGQRAVFEQINEVRYPTEFMGTILRERTEDADRAAEKPAAEKKPEPEPASEPTKLKFELEGEAPVPTSFETRNVGVTMEVEPTLDTQTMKIEMQISPQNIQLTGFDKHTVVTQPGDHRSTVEQPRFVDNKVTNTLTLKSGSRILLGQFRDATQPDWMELFILKATAKKVR